MRWRHLVILVCASCGDDRSAPVDARKLDDAHELDASGGEWSQPITISDPANASFVPMIATRGDTIVIAWHDFPAGGGTSRVVTRAIAGGVLGSIEVVPETLANPKRPTIAATTTGFVLAWDAVDTGISVIRSIDLDANGHAVGSPTTISAAGVTGSVPRVAAHGDDVVYAWTDGSSHFFARRGSVETVAATAVGTTLQAGGLLNFPRVAVTSTGTILLAYRDGGTMPVDWDVLLVIRQVGGTFLGPLNVSRSSGLLSDDISLAVEADDTVDFVWVDQDPIDVNSFDVTHATRSPAGLLSVPTAYITQQGMTWTPSAVPGLTAAWHVGGGAGGELWLSVAGATPQHVLASEQGGMVALAQSANASLHLAYVTTASPRQIRYAEHL